jgi:hypothetical protein
VSRNSGFGETELIARAGSVLRDRLPSRWRVSVAPPTGSVDAVLSIGPGDEVTARFAVEAKATLHGSATQLAATLRAKADRSPDPLLFVTEYVNPPLRQRCEDWGISYLDTTGWTFVVSDDPPILVRLEGAGSPPRRREGTATTRLNGPAAIRTIRCLLEEEPPLRIRQLARLSSSSPAAVSKLMPALVEAGAVDRAEDGTVTRIRRRTLLDRWTVDYGFPNSNGPVLDYLAPDGLPNLLDQLKDRNDLRVTGSAAARVYLTQGAPVSLVALYCADLSATAESLGLVRAGRDTANVIMTVPRDPTLLATPTPAGLPVAPLGQILADLRTLPGWLAREAEQLIDVLARVDPTWRE